MQKIFLYLYPIKEYTSMFLFSNDELYDNWNIKRPLPILNECIQKRYRDNYYQVVFVLYPDKDIFGIIPKSEDKVIYTDVTFKEFSAIDEIGKMKKDFVPKYPNSKLLIEQLGDIDKLVVGGYHAQDCVQKVAQTAFDLGIETLIDLDMTDYFFSLYRNETYFNINQYSPKKYKEYAYSKTKRYTTHFIDKLFNKTFQSPVYGFNTSKTYTKRL